MNTIDRYSLEQLVEQPWLVYDLVATQRLEEQQLFILEALRDIKESKCIEN